METPLVVGLIAAGASLLATVLANVAAYFVQRAKLRQELRTEFMTEQALVLLLKHEKWKLRNFETVRSYVGGFQDEELRRLLVRCGALRFVGDEGQEVWGLRARNPQRL